MKMNLKKGFKKGFTLIELLVVVAIIGILASVVLASLNTARSKGSDAAVKANLDDMRAQAAIDYDSWSNHYYNSTGGSLPVAITTVGSAYSCPGAVATTGLINDPTFCNGMVAAASASSGNVIYNGTIDGSWVAGANLKSVTGWWCVDSSGSSKTEAVGTDTTIVATTAICP
jgi:prepilin-type N-terminal cleavage/methylation domain-containing protein